MATHPFTTTASDAPDVRALLQARQQHGVSFTERGRWFFWRTFTVTAPPGVLESLKGQVKQLENELWGERQF